MAYLCVTCVPFNSQYKCFSTLNSTAWVSWKSSSASLLYSSHNRTTADLPAHLAAMQGLPEPSLKQFALVWLNLVINPILTPKTLQQALFPNIFSPSQGPAVSCSIQWPLLLASPLPQAGRACGCNTPADVILWDKTSPGAPKWHLNDSSPV